MNTAQIIALIVAGALAFPYVKQFFVKTNANPSPAKVETEMQYAIPETPTVSMVVESWSKLRNDCEKLGLTEAVEQLDLVFPLFVKKK